MKLLKLGLAIATSLALMVSVCFPVQASEESGEVDLSATGALTISDVSASGIGYHGATISWNTNGDATSQVFYDTEFHDDIADYACCTAEEPLLATEHSIRLTGLSSRTTYHYRVRSAIPDTEFITISEDCTFRTSSPAPPKPKPPIPEVVEPEVIEPEPEEPEVVEPEEPEVVEPEEEPTPLEEEPEVIEPEEEEPEVVEPEEEEEVIPYVPPEEPKETPWALIGGVLGGLAAAGGIGYWLWQRRRREANYGS